MSFTKVLLALVSMDLTYAASGPDATVHDVLRGSFPNAQENPFHGTHHATGRWETEERDAPRLSVMEEAARGMMPPPLWDTLFHEIPEILVPTNPDVESKTQPQARAGLLGLLAPYYLPGGKNVSRECRQDVRALSKGFTRGKLWALRVVDSWGKFSDGLIAGNLWAPGLLDECLRTTVDSQNPEAHFSGQYCSFSFGMKLNNTSPGKLLWDEGRDEDYWQYEEGEEYEEDVVGEVKKSKVMLPDFRIADAKGFLQTAVPYNLIATCIPSTCTEEEYRQSLEEQLDEKNLKLSLLTCQTRHLPTLRYNTADIIMIVALSLLGAAVLVGTVADVWIATTRSERLAHGPLRYFIVFSFYTNLPKIFRINTNESDETISCLHGIRAVTMGWVVMGHSYLLSFIQSPNKALAPGIVEEHPYFYQIVLNAYPSVDSFFVMSGLLVAYNLTKEFHRTSRFNAPLYYIHRFLRLAPPIMLLCGFFAVFPPLFVRGPISPLMMEKPYMVYSCIKHWWRDSFFLTNIFTGIDDGYSCLTVCWYTAVDFQLYIVTPFMFLPLLYRLKPGLVVMGVFLVASVALPMVIIGVNKLPPANVLDTTHATGEVFTKLVYSKPWCRASPYLVGLLLGYFLRVVDKTKVQLKWWQVALGWTVSLVTMSAIVFGLKDYNTLKPAVEHEYDATASILYGGLQRLAWGLAIAWLVFACHMGYGGPANSLLAHPIWQPLSRLTYTTFLISYNAQSLYYIFYARLPSYLTPFYKMMETVGMLMVCLCGALLLSLLTESPVLGLEKLLLGKGTNQKTQPDPSRGRTSSFCSPSTKSTSKHETASPCFSNHDPSMEPPYTVITSTQ